MIVFIVCQENTNALNLFSRIEPTSSLIEQIKKNTGYIELYKLCYKCFEKLNLILKRIKEIKLIFIYIHV